MNVLNTVLATTFAAIALISTGCSSSNNTSDATENNPFADGSNSSGDNSVNNGASMPETARPIFRLDNVGYQLIELLGGYSLSLTGKQIATIGEGATTTAIDSTASDSNGQVLVVGDNDPVPIDTIRYSCEQGGELWVNRAFYGQHSPSFSHSVEQNEYLFDQCRLSTDGEQTLDGSVLLSDELIFDTDGNTVDRSVQWTDFTWTKGDGFTLKLDASIKLSNSIVVINKSSRNVNITFYELLSGSQLIEAVKDGDFMLSITSSDDDDVQEYFLNANGRVSELSMIPVDITTDPTMTRKLVSEGLDVDSIPFSGQITMVAEDRSELILEAASSEGNNTLQVDSSYTDSVGNQSLLKTQNFVDLTIAAF